MLCGGHASFGLFAPEAIAAWCCATRHCLSKLKIRRNDGGPKQPSHTYDPHYRDHNPKPQEAMLPITPSFHPCPFDISLEALEGPDFCAST
jgi:hypothetical protein